MGADAAAALTGAALSNAVCERLRMIASASDRRGEGAVSGEVEQQTASGRDARLVLVP